MRSFIRLLSALCCTFIGLQTAASQAEKRVALVIGNAAYKSVPALPNAKKDAQDIAAALTAAGFEVVPHFDLGIAEMRKALKAFEDKATGADWAVVYYAGHGIASSTVRNAWMSVVMISHSRASSRRKYSWRMRLPMALIWPQGSVG